MIRLLIASSLLIGTTGMALYPAAAANLPGANGMTIAQAAPAPPEQSPAEQRPPGRQHRQIDFAAAASELGISEAELREALGVTADSSTQTGHRRLDIPGAAASLNVTEERLVEALGIPPRPPRPDLAAAADRLGVSEDELKAALGIPENPPAEGARSQRPPRSDFAAAAATLGVSEQQLVEALGIPARPPGDRPDDRPANP